MSDAPTAGSGQRSRKDLACTSAANAYQKQFGADLKRRVVVNADQTAKWQAVVEVMDLLRAQGIESVTFSARKS